MASKYFNKKVELDGFTFDSKLESNRYLQLKYLLLNGKISQLTLQKEFELQPSFKAGKQTIRAVKYIADFYYIDEFNREICEDAKGFITDVYAIKKKMFMFKYQNIIFKEIKK